MTKLPDDVIMDVDFICVDKEFFYFLLSCLIAQRNMGKMDYDRRNTVQEAVDRAFDDGINLIKGVDFIPKSDQLFRSTVIKLSDAYMQDKLKG